MRHCGSFGRVLAATPLTALFVALAMPGCGPGISRVESEIGEDDSRADEGFDELDPLEADGSSVDESRFAIEADYHAAVAVLVEQRDWALREIERGFHEAPEEAAPGPSAVLRREGRDQAIQSVWDRYERDLEALYEFHRSEMGAAESSTVDY